MEELRAKAHGHPAALAAATRAHAAWLEALHAQRDVLQHHVIIVVTTPGRDTRAATATRRKAREVAQQITAGMDVPALVCDADQVRQVLRASLTPSSPPSSG